MRDVRQVEQFTRLELSFRSFLEGQIAVFVRRSQEAQHQAMDLGEPQHFGCTCSAWVQGVMQVDALENLEEPAQRRTRRRLALLIRDRLPGLCEAVTQAYFGPFVDQQAPRHDEGQRHDALRAFDEDRRGEEERIFQEGEAAFDSLNANDKNARAHSRAWSGSHSESPHPRR